MCLEAHGEISDTCIQKKSHARIQKKGDKPRRKVIEETKPVGTLIWDSQPLERTVRRFISIGYATQSVQ